jgi:DNA invertase Pin-like site-specific DNA recombinase
MANRNSTPRVALYARVSTKDNGQDPETQLLALRECVKARGLEIFDEYVDVGISGSKESRPALDRLMADARRGRFDAVLVARFDRFARSTRHLVMALEEFNALGVNFISLSESIDTSTPMGKMVYTVIAAVAELERSLIRERVIMGLQRAKAQGKKLGRPKVNISEDQLLSLYQAGLSSRQIAKQLGLSPSTVLRRLRAASKTR